MPTAPRSAAQKAADRRYKRTLCRFKIEYPREIGEAIKANIKAQGLTAWQVLRDALAPFMPRR